MVFPAPVVAYHPQDIKAILHRIHVRFLTRINRWNRNLCNPQALHQCHREQMSLLILLLLSQQTHQHLGLMCGKWCTLPIWTGGGA